jgi:hypothetical protein
MPRTPIHPGEHLAEELRETGLANLSVFSGAHKGAVKLVADQLKLDQAYSGLLPADKAGQVKALKEQGHLVAFVGDGINDAPALAVADIGIAMGGSGTDIALETADVVLLNDRLNCWPRFRSPESWQDNPWKSVAVGSECRSTGAGIRDSLTDDGAAVLTWECVCGGNSARLALWPIEATA